MKDNTNCTPDCPKGGKCLRTVEGTTEGALIVKNHFKCLMIQQFILGNVGKIKILK